MASPIQAMAAAALREVEIGPLRWRIRKINSRLLNEAQRQGLTMLPHTPEALAALSEVITARAEERAPTPEAQASLASALLQRLQSAKPEELAAAAMERGQVVAAGVVAVALGDEWQDTRIVLNGTPTDAEAGILHIDDLPPGVDERLYAEIMAHTNDGEGAAQRIAAFRA